MTTDKRNSGLFCKYIVTRADGSSKRGGRHHDCEYFVLDLDHDPHAHAALGAYAESCRAAYPVLADDLVAKQAAMASAGVYRGPDAGTAAARAAWMEEFERLVDEYAGAVAETAVVNAMRPFSANAIQVRQAAPALKALRSHIRTRPGAASIDEAPRAP